MLKRDIKLIRRNGQSIEQLRGDIHVQIYYKQKTKAKDAWLKEQQVNVQNDSLENLYNRLRYDVYKKTTFIVAWIDKETLVSRINSMQPNERQWSFPGSSRYFWKCSLRNARKPAELILFLKDKMDRARAQTDLIMNQPAISTNPNTSNRIDTPYMHVRLTKRDTRPDTSQPRISTSLNTSIRINTPYIHDSPETRKEKHDSPKNTKINIKDKPIIIDKPNKSLISRFIEAIKNIFK